MRRKIEESNKMTEVDVYAVEKPQLSNFYNECEALKKVLQNAYEEPVMIQEAERLASRFLAAQMQAAELLKDYDLDARMRKNGVKAVRAAIWHKAATADEKKPSDKMLDSIVDMDKLVQDEQTYYDTIDATKASISTYLEIFKDGHIFFRGIAKGKYE